MVDENGAVRRVPVVDESSLSEESSSDENRVENSGSEKVDVMAWSEYYALGKGHYRTVWQHPVSFTSIYSMLRVVVYLQSRH